MLVSHPGLFHVERLPQGFSRAESLALIDWAGKRPGGSQRQPLGRSPPADTLWALRLTRSPPTADAWRACRETHLGCGRPLESILRHLRLCRPVCCRWWRVFCVCPVVCRSCGCCVAASLVLSFPSFGLAGGLVGSAPGEELVAAGGAIWTDLQRGSSRVTQPEVAFGVRDLRPAHVGGSCRCRSIGEAF